MSLVLSKLDKTYKRFGRPPVRAVCGLDLEVRQGEAVALLGSSGCGKTSTLRMIAGFESLSGGAITLAGRRIDPLPPARRGVAMAFEGYALYPPLTVAENIGFALHTTRAERRKASERVRAVAEMLDIGAILHRRPASLSGGQQQRASLARALVRDADLHLLDEPMSQLEPQLRAVLRGRVKAYLGERGFTTVFVTHDQTEAHALADRIAVMEAGVLEQFGSPDELRDRPKNLFVATFFGEPPMNALVGRVKEGAMEIEGGDGRRFSIALPAAATAPEGARLVLGVRPQRIRLGAGALSGTVLSNQWLGDQAHVALACGALRIVAVSLARVAAPSGTALPFAIAPEDMHLFDPESGTALSHRGSCP
ncbi:MAG TPA: ABC transporter ATP-binding protein [Acetobacteraceae bacterium]|nr:ABC transporter ATP-binding protein [Acetobacteraceae bacterium]